MILEVDPAEAEAPIVPGPDYFLRDPLLEVRKTSCWEKIIVGKLCDLFQWLGALMCLFPERIPTIVFGFFVLPH